MTVTRKHSFAKFRDTFEETSNSKLNVPAMNTDETATIYSPQAKGNVFKHSHDFTWDGLMMFLNLILLNFRDRNIISVNRKDKSCKYS